MTLGALVDLGQIVAAIATLASVLYLAVQIRQNSRLLKEEAARSTLETTYRINLLMVERAEIADLAMRGAGETGRLDPIDYFRLHMLWMTVFLSYQDAYLHASRSLIERHLWQVHEGHMLQFLARPGLAKWWGQNRSRFAAEFADHVDERRAASP